jgi:hypothetical protein
VTDPDENSQRQARLPIYKNALLKLLRRAAVAEAVIEYDGEGDDGQIISVTLNNAVGTELPDKPLSARAMRTFSELHLSPCQIKINPFPPQKTKPLSPDLIGTVWVSHPASKGGAFFTILALYQQDPNVVFQGNVLPYEPPG